MHHWIVLFSLFEVSNNLENGFKVMEVLILLQGTQMETIDPTTSYMLQVSVIWIFIPTKTDLIYYIFNIC